MTDALTNVFGKYDMITSYVDIIVLFVSCVGISWNLYSIRNTEQKRKIETRIQKSIDEIERRKSAIRRKGLEASSKVFRIFAVSGAP